MALDPNIFNNLGKGVTPLMNNMEIAQQVQQTGLGMMKNQEVARSMADALSYRKRVAAGEDPAAILQSQGNVKGAHEVATARYQTQKAQHDAQKAQIEAHLADVQRTGALWGAVTDEASYQNVRAQMIEMARAKGADMSNIPLPDHYDPSFVSTQAKQAMTVDQQLRAALNAETARHNKEMETKEKQATPHAGIGPDGKPTFFTMGPGNAAVPVSGGFKPIPSPVLGLAPGTAPAGNFDQPLRDIGREAKAQAIARGEQPMLEESSRSPGNREVNARAAQIAAGNGGTLSGKNEIGRVYKGKADFEPSGKAGQTIGALNTMTEHLATARRMAEALQNGDIQAFNALRQKFQTATGQAAPTDFATVKQFLAGEVAKVATGGHITEGEIHAASDRLNQAQSPAQLMGALDTMQEIAGGKLVALNQDYKRLFGKDVTERLTPATRAAFAKADKHINSGGETSDKSAPKTLSQAELGKLPPKVAQDYLNGKTIEGPDGTRYKKGN